MFAGPLGRSTFTPPKSSFDSPLYGLVSLRRSHHLFFRHWGKQVRNRQSTEGLGRSIDVRGDGGYVVVAPSVHVSGVSYEWPDFDSNRVIDCPEWLQRELVNPTSSRGSRTLSTGAALAEWIGAALTSHRLARHRQELAARGSTVQSAGSRKGRGGARGAGRASNVTSRHLAIQQ